MTGSAAFSVGRPTSARSRWVGRSTLLPGHPFAPPAIKYIAVTSSFFGLQLIWAAEMAQASPFLLSLGVSKSMMAVVFVAGPLSGLLAQPLVGVLSDSCKSKFGRRRPFIFAGVIISSLSIALLAWAKTAAAWFAQDGGTAHRRLAISFAILAVYLVDFSVNVVQAMDRALIVDVVPPAEQASANAWAARMFGFGAVFGYGLGTLDLVRWSGGYMGDSQLKVIAVFTVAFVCVTHAITISCVEERVLISTDDDASAASGHPAFRAVKDVWRTLRTIPKPIQAVFNVQFTSWLGWFPVLFFTTTWIAEIYVTTLLPTSYSDLADAPTSIQEAATRAGTTAMFYHSLVALLTSILVPPLVAPTYPVAAPARIDNHPYHSTSSTDGVVARIGRCLPIPWLTLPLLWTVATAAFGSLLLLCSVIGSVQGATVAVALIGFCWACTNWIPFAVLADLILQVDAPSTTSKSIGARPLSIAGGAHSIMLHSSRGRSYRETNASTSTINVHTLGSSSDGGSVDGDSADEGKGRGIIDLDRTPRPVSSFVPHPESAAPSPSFSFSTYQDLPPTPATGTSTFSNSTAYFDLPSPALSEHPNPSPVLSTPPLPRSSPSTATLSPIASPEQVGNAQRPRRNTNRSSIASSATFDYPPNNGDATFDFSSSFEALGESDGSGGVGSPRSSAGSSGGRASGEFRPDRRHVGAGTFAFLQQQQGQGQGQGRGGASQSTIKLALDPPGTAAAGDDDDDDAFEFGPRSTIEPGRRTVRVRHSDDLSSLGSSRYDRGRFEVSDRAGSDDDDDDDEADGLRGGKPRTQSVPRIRVGRADGSEGGRTSEEDEDRWLNEEHDVGGSSFHPGAGGGGGDQAGVILGCHNIYIVLPQFLVTALSSIIFAILDPGKSVLGSHGLPPPPTTTTSSPPALDSRVPNSLPALATFVARCFVRTRRAQVEADESGVSRGYSSLSLIFQIGGIAALVSAYICFRLWRDTVHDRRRATRRQTGYGRVEG
ncbi:hypothetical protein JCM11491_005835 [Sporobolomyces phaffii]